MILLEILENIVLISVDLSIAWIIYRRAKDLIRNYKLATEDSFVNWIYIFIYIFAFAYCLVRIQ